MFSRLKLTYKLVSISLFYSLLLILVTGISYYGFNIMDEKATQMQEESEALKLVKDYEGHIVDMNLVAMELVNDAAAGLNHNLMEEMKKLEEEIGHAFSTLEQAADHEDEKALLREIAAQKVIFMKAIAHDLPSAIRDKAGAERLEELDQIFDGAAITMRKDLRKFIQSIEKEIQLATAECHKARQMAYTIILVGGLAIIIGVVLNIFLANSISKPIDLTSKEIDDSAGQVNSASKEVSDASQSLAEASSEQASSIEEISASLEELTRMVENNTSGAEKSADLSNGMQKSSEAANTSMQELIRSMAMILESNQDIQKLTQVIAEIGEKTAVIDEIVFQTKLLSFNASVEAERAGEHGRGFAVVAQEVGNLAQMSGKAALEISTIVHESIRNAEQITTSNKEKVETGNKLVNDVATVLREITANSREVNNSAKQIVSASKDQAAGISQINDAISQLDKVTQENASTAEETASSSEELSAQASKMIEFVAALRRIVNGQQG